MCGSVHLGLNAKLDVQPVMQQACIVGQTVRAREVCIFQAKSTLNKLS